MHLQSTPAGLRLVAFLCLIFPCVQSIIATEVTAQSTPADASNSNVKIDLSPQAWPEGESGQYHQLNSRFGSQNHLARSKTGIITGTTSASAIRAGLEALNQGGSAVDAALTTSLTQIALAQGSWVSYAGIITMIHYDAQSQRVFCMNAGYNTILAEDDPLSIPKVASGRTALVPGYMAGVESAHQKFGKLPFQALFSPAIYYAEQGFVLHRLHASMINRRQDTLSRFPETKQLFTNRKNGEFYSSGDEFKQPALANTLRAVSQQGAAYMYQGPWADKLVAAVRADGGKMTAEDLQRYQVLWNEPIRVEFADYQIYGPGLPAQGGVHLAETLHLITLAKLKEKGHYSTSPESFFWLSQFNMVSALSYLPPATQTLLFGKATPLEFRRTKAFAEQLWPRMQDGKFALTQKPKGMGDNHSDAIVAMDQWGNITSICHTINTSAWGQTGIFVDGVSIPDSASFQQALIAQTEPGGRLPDPTMPLIVMKGDKPFAALSSIGAGLQAKTVSTLINLIDFDQDIKTAVDAPSLHLPDFATGTPATQQVFEGDFSDELIEGVRKMGLKIKVVPNNLQSRAPRGYVVGATINPATGERQAVSTRTLNGTALGQ